MKPELSYLVFAMEYYRSKNGLSGREVARLFSEHRIYDLIERNYFLYHIESPDIMVSEVDETIAKT